MNLKSVQNIKTDKAQNDGFHHVLCFYYKKSLYGRDTQPGYPGGIEMKTR